jgi:predicted nuclease of predicted toxin-antitoxin system
VGEDRTVNFLVDECCAGTVVRGLRSDGHQVNAIRESILRGSADTTVMLTASEASQILITDDRDFGELVYRAGFAARGVIYVKLGNAPPEEKLRRIRDLLEREADRIEGSFVVIDPNRIRIRALPVAPNPPNLPGSD